MGRNLALDVLVAVGMGVTMALISSILPTVARRGGLTPIGLSALAAAPFVANLLGAFAGRFGPRNTAHLGLVRGLGAAALLVLFLVPPAPVVVVVAVVFWLSISFGGPFHLRLWGAMYPARLRGRVVGVLGMGRAAAGALAAFIGGVLADVIGGEQAVAIAGIVGVACAIGYLGLRAAAAEQPRSYSARESIRALRDRPALSRIAVAQGFYGGGLIAASPLFALVHVDRLNLSLADVGVIGILTAVATTVAFPLWGLVADRFGAVAALKTGSAIGLLSLVGYAVAPSVVRPLVRRGRGRDRERLDRRRDRGGGQRSDAARLAGGRDGRLERPDRRPRDRGGLPDERPAPDRADRRHGRAARLHGDVRDRRRDVRASRDESRRRRAGPRRAARPLLAAAAVKVSVPTV